MEGLLYAAEGGGVCESLSKGAAKSEVLKEEEAGLILSAHTAEFIIQLRGRLCHSPSPT